MGQQIEVQVPGGHVGIQILFGRIDDRVQLAQHVARKPIVFGEFGFQTTRAQFLARPRAARYSGRDLPA